jgi:hypothetical protein
MAGINGPKIVRDGLILCLDAADRKSYLGSGTFWNDLTTNANNGTISGSPTFSNSNGGYFNLDASNDYVDCGNGSSINFGTGNFTIEIWATRSTNATTNLRLLGKGGDSDAVGSAGFAFFGADSGLTFTINPTAARSFVSAAGYSVGEWFQVVGLIERGVSMRAYKNTVLAGSTTAPSGSVSNASVNLNIGRNTAGANLYWSGNIAIVRMYNRALSTSEISQNFNAVRKRFNI